MHQRYAIAPATNHTRPCVTSIRKEPDTYEVFSPMGALEEHIAYAKGQPDDIQAFYASQHPGAIELRKITVQDISHHMAERAITRSVRRTLNALDLETNVWKSTIM